MILDFQLLIAAGIPLFLYLGERFEVGYYFVVAATLAVLTAVEFGPDHHLIFIVGIILVVFCIWRLFNPVREKGK